MEIFIAEVIKNQLVNLNKNRDNKIKVGRYSFMYVIKKTTMYSKLSIKQCEEKLKQNRNNSFFKVKIKERSFKLIHKNIKHVGYRYAPTVVEGKIKEVNQSSVISLRIGFSSIASIIIINGIIIFSGYSAKLLKIHNLFSKETIYFCGIWLLLNLIIYIIVKSKKIDQEELNDMHDFLKDTLETIE